MYQTGGQVEPSIMDYLSQLQGVQQKYQGDVMTGAGASKYNPEGMLTKEGLSELYDFPLEQMTLDTLMAGPRTRKIAIKGPEREAEHLQTLFGLSEKEKDEAFEKTGIRKQLTSAYPTESSGLAYFMDDAGKAIKALDAGYLDMDMFKRMDWERKNKQLGGPVNQYGHGGQMQPRRQQEMRNPEVYGPPVPANLDSVLKQIMMRDVNESINPFSGESLDFEGDSLRLLQKMNESRGDTTRTGMPLSPYGQNLQRGGVAGPEVYGPPEPTGRQNIEAMQASGMLGQGQPLERRTLMGDANQDSRIAPMPMIEPDEYRLQLIPNAPQDTTMMKIPKLSSAYLSSFGVETPLSKRQNSLLQERQIPPQMLNSQVSGLIDRALVQRLTKEPL